MTDIDKKLDWKEVTVPSRLRELAEKAKGGWSFGLGHAEHEGKVHSALWFNNDANSGNQSSFIVRCNPETIIAILDGNKNLEAQILSLQLAMKAKDEALENCKLAAEWLMLIAKPGVEMYKHEMISSADITLQRIDAALSLPTDNLMLEDGASFVWGNTKDYLAISLVGFAQRKTGNTLTDANNLLDDLTEEGAPLSYLRKIPRYLMKGKS